MPVDKQVKAERWDEVDVLPTQAADAQVTNRPPGRHSEEIQRIEVDDEDRLAFRVGVNLLTLALLGLGIYFLVLYLRT